ncbi:restriction endonuclease subunit S [Helicobacter pylori]|uniref:restriction endonuclease subunit S n=1 Tax=Helicobacter pylori TaxID=210 RepID=UPI0013F40B2F|nr:restriction endonuclease subunit S [Helicobacter pylori]MBH0257418.1 restriction endonuclease subunit S [Helicobacter pylori]MBH0273289.1 restriction endonuclease subunit S [Helicobacter pylori]NHA86927.1 restriction endonuclease subunit S [Helicobacter pylori]
MIKLLDLKNHSVIAINQNNYTKKDNYKKVCYLDTDNITNNRINAFLKIDLTKEKLPSRAKRKCSINSIIYSSVRPNQRHFGIIKEIPKNFLVSTAFIVIDVIDLEKLDPNYLYYYITQDKITHYLQRIAECGTSSYPSITPLDFLNIKIKLYPLETQQKIARTLSVLDQKIENNHKINELLHKILELLYEQYFVRFDFLDENNKPYQTSGGKMKFSKELNRLIPNDFEVKTLGELITWISGSQPPKSCHIYEHKEGYIRFIQNRDYSSNDYITYIPISKNNKICYQYDIMMDKYGEAGSVRFGLQGAYNVALSKISVLNQSMQEYIRSYLNSKPIKKYLSNACMASTRASLNENHIYSLMLPIPPINLLQKYEKIAKNIITAIINNNQSTQTLTALRDFLLPLLLKQQVKPK